MQTPWEEYGAQEIADTCKRNQLLRKVYQNPYILLFFYTKINRIIVQNSNVIPIGYLSNMKMPLSPAKSANVSMTQKQFDKNEYRGRL